MGVFALTAPILRLFGVIHWPWGVALSPFTVIGAGTAMTVVFSVYREPLAAFGAGLLGRRAAAVKTTPPPDRLEAAPAAGEAGEQILADHPEILAALCHGFRMKKLLPSVLGHPVTDPWGVYHAALTASPTRLSQLRILAATHTAVFARTRRKEGGRISDAQAMRLALDAFRPCAQKSEAGRGHPDCPFEHVTVIFGAESPNRDANLRSVAPKVRALLERQYPQLRTARLSDGSEIAFAQWQRSAAEDRAEIGRLRKDLERQTRTVEELRRHLADSEARVEALEGAAERQRRQAHEAARDEQQRIVADLRAAVDRADRDRARELQRYEAEMAKISASHDAIAAERDALEAALLTAGSSTDDPDATFATDLTGVRVLLVGGETRQMAPLRERLESLGARLLHDDSVAAAEHVSRVHVVVFWIRYLSHPTYFGVRQKVRALKVPHGYWTRTSPSSLAALVASILAAGQTPTRETPVVTEGAGTVN